MFDLMHVVDVEIVEIVVCQLKNIDGTWFD